HRRLEAGLLERFDDVVGGPFDALGVDAATLALGAGEEEDILPHPFEDGIIEWLLRGGWRGQRDKEAGHDGGRSQTAQQHKGESLMAGTRGYGGNDELIMPRRCDFRQGIACSLTKAAAEIQPPPQQEKLMSR